MFKNINGKQVEMSPEEELELTNEWAEFDQLGAQRKIAIQNVELQANKNYNPRRMDYLILKKIEGTLTPQEVAEVNAFILFEENVATVKDQIISSPDPKSIKL